MSRQHFLLLGFLVCTSVISLAYAVREKLEANSNANSRDQLRTTLADVRAEIHALSSQFGSRTDASASASTPPPSAPQRHVFASVPRRRAVAQSSARPRAVDDPRWKHIESQLTQQQSKLAEQGERISQTQEVVQKTGDRLDGKINSTRDELNRSIATTHDDVVQLQKRGEHNIYEFDLTKSKQFQRVGPFSLSLRKADAKHRFYDLTLMVDDTMLDKQHVNLFEPVWINLADRPQPIQLVVNKIDKNRVSGYIREPRYRNVDLAGAPGTPQSPALKPR
jgi:hypothetical protein